MSEDTISGFFTASPSTPPIEFDEVHQAELNRLQGILDQYGYAIYERKQIIDCWNQLTEKLNKKNQLIDKQNELIEIYKKQVAIYKEYTENMGHILKGDYDAVATQTSTKNGTEKSGFKETPSEKKAEGFEELKRLLKKLFGR